MTARDEGRHHGDDRRDEQEQVGSVAEETAKLLGALQDWAGEAGLGRAGTAAQGLVEGLRSVDDHVGHGEDCRWCPVCRLVNAARSTTPEVREHLAVAIGSLAQAATAALRQGDPAEGRDRGEGSGPTKVDLDD